MEKTHELNIPEEYYVIFQELDMNTKLFIGNIKKRLYDSDFSLGKVKSDILDDENIGLLYVNKDKAFPLCTAKWKLLGFYSKLSKFESDDSVPDDEIVVDVKDEVMGYTWIYPWNIIDEPKHDNLKECLKNLPEQLKLLNNNFIHFQDPMVISYLLSFFTSELKLEHVYIFYNGEMFSAIGLTDIKWIYEEEPDLVKEYENEINKMVDQTDEPDIKWKNLIDLFTKMCNGPKIETDE